MPITYHGDRQQCSQRTPGSALSTFMDCANLLLTMLENRKQGYACPGNVHHEPGVLIAPKVLTLTILSIRSAPPFPSDRFTQVVNTLRQ